MATPNHSGTLSKKGACDCNRSNEDEEGSRRLSGQQTQKWGIEIAINLDEDNEDNRDHIRQKSKK